MLGNKEGIGGKETRVGGGAGKITFLGKGQRGKKGEEEGDGK